MDEQRVGRILRAVRRRLGLTQAELAAKAGLSQQTVSLIERGVAGPATLRLARQVGAPMGVTIGLTLDWRGPDLERLADARHASIVNEVVRRLGPAWRVMVEYSFNDFGDRGSVDVLAWNEGARGLLLIEVKSELVSAEALLRSMDIKARVVPRLIAAQNGWRNVALGSVLVLPDEATSRRAVDRMAALFDAALPSRTVAVRHWIDQPAGPVRGIWFLAVTPPRRTIRNPGSAGLIRHARNSKDHAPRQPEEPS